MPYRALAPAVVALLTASGACGQAHSPEPAKPPSAAHGEPAHDATAAHATDAHADPSPFTGGIGNSILTLAIFLTVAAILARRAWPHVLKALNDREQSIRDALEKAKHEREEAEKLLARYQEQLDTARQEASGIVDEGRRDAEEVRRRIQEQARLESNEMVARAKREIQLASDAAVKEIYDRAAELAVQVASGIIKKELKADDHRALVSESIQRMQATQN